MFKVAKNRKVRHVLLLGLLLLVSLFFVASLEAADNDVNSYIVIMELDPVISYDGQIRGFAATQPAEGDKVNPNSTHVLRYQAFLQNGHEDSLEAAGASVNQQVHNYTISLNGYSALLTENQAKAIEGQEGVLLVMEDELYQPATDNSADFLGLDVEGGAWDTGFTGEDVVVGVIDTGIWPEHPSFADDGSYTTLPGFEDVPCEFGNTDHHPADVPFTCNNKLIGARDMLSTYRWVLGAQPHEFASARDDGGHGTHTASTAAGNAGVTASIFGVDHGEVSGVAPRARVIAYKGLGEQGGFGSDLAAAIDQAVADGVDVINYSIGGGAGLLRPDGFAFLRAAEAGVFVAVSAGNSGPSSGTIGGPANAPWLTTVGASTQNRTFQGSASSGNDWEYFGSSITAGTDELPLVDAADAGDELCYPGSLDSDIVAGKIVLCKRGAIARVAKSQAVYLAGGAGMIMYNASDSQSQVSDNHWVPSVHINNTDGLAIKAYIASSANPVAQINAGEKVTIDAPKMAAFSSRGSNTPAEDIIKPDITAPGVEVLAGITPVHYGAGVQGELFETNSGTSMSGPHIAGIFALIKQAHPDWSPAMAKSAVMTSAYQDVAKEDGNTPADPFDMGAGHVKPVQVLARFPEFPSFPGDPGFPDAPSGFGTLLNTPFDPGLVYDAGLYDYLGFLCDAAPEAFGNPEATCGYLESVGVPTDASDLNLASIGIAELTGSQTVQRTVTAEFGNDFSEFGVPDHFRNRRRIVFWPTVEAPEGFEVTVSPRVLVLRNGESATYSVTITNVDAPINEWSFGSLTWEGFGYEVYSPIAVRAQLFNAPAEVNGSGESSSADFGIKFGYTGAYSAAAHGLEPATVTSANVVQDPDQNFNPGDGYSNLHQFTLSGAAHFRVAIPPEATEADADLDVFVFDPNGNFVASSTAGGTDELIDIENPADGTWTVFVQGWSAPGGDSDYDMYTWAISATPGGSLAIDSAPTSATLGATEAINVSWTGAAAGQWYLGAVSHTGDAGLMGLTLVDVDNR